MSKVTDRESTQIIRSKYFSTESAMDESLTDFQEPKKLAGPKKSNKVKSGKPRKAPKRIRGQKDIRAALQSHKNELESYSKDFDNVCRQAGLDVDSEQLQLAIALSKSLHQSECNSDSPETSQTLTSQDRVGKIRTTLLEYGFKVPEIKIKTSKRLKKRKQYKLLLTSEDTKKQIIADKYSQVLFENISLSNNCPITDVDVTHINLYHLATSATFSILKSIDTFYVDNLLEKSTATGNLLRDWSEIPGRPVSPKLCEPINMNFSEIDCSQEELDVVLSGTLKSCKNVLENKEKTSVGVNKFDKKDLVKLSNLDNSVIVLLDDENTKSNDNETLKVQGIEVIKNPVVDNTLKTSYNEVIDLDEPMAIVNQCRSCSPDLFDDEPSNLEELNQSSQESTSSSYNTPKGNSFNNNLTNLIKSNQGKPVTEVHSINANVNSQLSQNTNVTRMMNDFMEITECVDTQYIDIETTNKSSLKLQQNITKRKSNDFMDITKCVGPLLPLPIEGDIDLTQSSDEINANNANKGYETLKEASQKHTTKIVQTNINVTENRVEETTNLLRHSNKEISKSEDNNIDLTQSPELANDTAENKADRSVESLDLTQSSNTSDELPFVSLKTSNKLHSADDTIIMDPKEYEGIPKSEVSQNDAEILDITQNKTRDEVNSREFSNNLIVDQNDNPDNTENEQSSEVLNLTQEITTTSRHISKTSHVNISFFGEYVHNHSDNNDVHSVSRNNLYQDRNVAEESPVKNVGLDVDEDRSSIKHQSSALDPTPGPSAKSAESDDIDLTQNTDSSEELSQSPHKKDRSKTNENHMDRESAKYTEIEMEIDKSSQSNIDLTQNSDSEEPDDLWNNDSIKDQSKDVESSDNDTIEMEVIKSSQRCSSLGKKDNVSVDYDEMFDNLDNRHSQSQESRTSQSKNNTPNVSNKRKDISNCSQDSDVFVISDNELDYSMHQSKLEKPVENFLLGGISIMDEFSGLGSFRKSTNIENNSAAANKNLTTNILSEDDVNKIEIEHVRKTPVKHKRVNELATPQKPGCSGINTVVTPNNQYVIKTVDVTPMPKYEAMSLEELHTELDKFGVKPFKRKRAVQLLMHIYNQTHPTIEPFSDEDSPCKRRKTNNYNSPQKLYPTKLTPRKILSPKKTAKSPRKVPERKSPKKVAEKKRKENDRVANSEDNKRLNDIEVVQISRNHEVNETPVIKDVECNSDDWVFQKREKAKVHSCRVPLHIAFHNYVLSRPALREAILCYEPINIDDIHKDLVAYGHRYDPKDLLKYMDKKCITVKTNDNDARNQKR